MIPAKYLTLSVFHAFTGCDTVSAFAGRGQKTAWETWKSFPEVTDALQELLAMPSEVSEGSRSLIERFVLLMYDRTSECMEVNYARKHLFSQKSRTLENIPSTQAALKVCLSTSSRLAFRPTCGTSHWSWIRRYQSHLTGAGQKNPLGVSHSGQLSLKQQNLAMS